MSIGFGVSLCVRGETVDAGPLLQRHRIEVHRVGDVVRFAADPDALAELAAPLTWWQSAVPTSAGQVVLRFVGPNGVTELGYCTADRAVGYIRQLIVSESGRFHGDKAVRHGVTPTPDHRSGA